MDVDPRSIPAENPRRGKRRELPARPVAPPPVSRAVDVAPVAVPGWRVALYLLLPGVAALAFVGRLAEAEDAAVLERVLQPNGPLGWAQIALVAVSGTGLGLLARRLHSTLHTLLALLAVGLLLRELHDALGSGGGALHGLIKDDVWRRAWQATFLFMLILGWVRRSTLRREMPSFARRAGFWLLFAALFCGGVLGEVLGERDLWRALARPELGGVARDAVQGLLALAGHVLLGAGVCEEWGQFRRR